LIVNNHKNEIIAFMKFYKRYKSILHQAIFSYEQT